MARETWILKFYVCSDSKDRNRVIVAPKGAIDTFRNTGVGKKDITIRHKCSRRKLL